MKVSSGVSFGAISLGLRNFGSYLGKRIVIMGAGESKTECTTPTTFADHEDAITAMCISDDQSVLITTSDDKTARMWVVNEPKTECLGVLKGHTEYITCVATHDTFVLTGSADDTIRKWDMSTCECLEIYEGHTSRVFRVICTEDWIFSTSYDATARAWRFDTSDLDEEEDPCVRIFKGHAKAVLPIVFIPGENEDQTNDDGINAGDIVITASVDGTARSWSFETAGCLKVFKGHTGPISCMTVDEEGKILFTGSMDNTIRSWNIATGRTLKVFQGHENGVVCLQMSKTMLYSGSTDGTARAWVAEFADCTRIYKGHKHTVTSIKHKNGILFTGCGDTMARAFDAKSGALRVTFKAHEAGITVLTVVGDSLFTGGSDGALMRWDLKSMPGNAELPGYEDFSKSNKQAAG
jgi:WD40 repeat protein